MSLEFLKKGAKATATALVGPGPVQAASTLYDTIRSASGYAAQSSLASPADATASSPSAVASNAGAQSDVHVVQPGESLSVIAQAVLGDGRRWPELAEMNGLSAPYVIHPGQSLLLPGGVCREGGAQVLTPGSVPAPDKTKGGGKASTPVAPGVRFDLDHAGTVELPPINAGAMLIRRRVGLRGQLTLQAINAPAAVIRDVNGYAAQATTALGSMTSTMEIRQAGLGGAVVATEWSGERTSTGVEVGPPLVPGAPPTLTYVFAPAGVDAVVDGWHVTGSAGLELTVEAIPATPATVPVPVEEPSYWEAHGDAIATGALVTAGFLLFAGAVIMTDGAALVLAPAL